MVPDNPNTQYPNASLAKLLPFQLMELVHLHTFMNCGKRAIYFPQTKKVSQISMEATMGCMARPTSPK